MKVKKRLNAVMQGRFHGHAQVSDGGRFSQHHPGRYETAQAGRVPVISSEDVENFMFDIQTNIKDTVKFVVTQRTFDDYISTRNSDVGKIFYLDTKSSIPIPTDQNHARREREVMITSETSAKKM